MGITLVCEGLIVNQALRENPYMSSFVALKSHSRQVTSTNKEATQGNPVAAPTGAVLHGDG